ncbi:hypothetical protein [Pedobacter frigoris]|uniref:DoxX family protein n=1 Tax=Pedobacter frigoris TaxID=2571272 RepID=A0A4U1CNI8_9SPHI|nr:hypothetical protein [Pedobacter frigoris]TKC09064.1 hypothetical protein FA047_02920 [Pedobacter frigoris]
MRAWTPVQRLSFRFVFILFILFTLFVNNGAYPLFYVLMQFVTELMHQFIPWVGKYVLKLPYEITEFTGGSGDTTYDYVVLLFITTIAVTGTIIWTVLDRKSLNYPRLYYWLTVAVRFYVGIMLFNYGMVKVIKLQFPSPGISRLMMPYGESSPMGLAWTFMGFSKGYNLFMGFAEVMALLLLFRRTVTLGALICFAVTANVMAINYFYDVPVKIVSTALFLMSAFLLAPNAIKFYRLLIKGEAVALRKFNAPEIQKRWLYVTKYSVKYIILFLAVIMPIYGLLQSRKMYGDAAAKSPLYGAYDVKQFIRNSKAMAIGDDDAFQWKQLRMEGVDKSSIMFMNDAIEFHSIKTDTKTKKISIAFNEDPDSTHILKYVLPNPDSLVLSGKIYDDSVRIALKKKHFILTERGFHWINEKPYSR